MHSTEGNRKLVQGYIVLYMAIMHRKLKFEICKKDVKQSNYKFDMAKTKKNESPLYLNRGTLNAFGRPSNETGATYQKRKSNQILALQII